MNSVLPTDIVNYIYDIEDTIILRKSRTALIISEFFDEVSVNPLKFLFEKIPINIYAIRMNEYNKKLDYYYSLTDKDKSGFYKNYINFINSDNAKVLKIGASIVYESADSDIDSDYVHEDDYNDDYSIKVSNYYYNNIEDIEHEIEYIFF